MSEKVRYVAAVDERDAWSAARWITKEKAQHVAARLSAEDPCTPRCHYDVYKITTTIERVDTNDDRPSEDG